MSTIGSVHQPGSTSATSADVAPSSDHRAGLAGHHDLASDVGLLLLRLLPLVMFVHGLHKATHFAGFEKTVASNPVGAMAPQLFSFMVVAGQLVLPILVALGIFTRLAAGLEALMMLSIWVLMFAMKGLVDAKTGGPSGESALTYVFLMLPLVFTGAGRFSVDHWWSHRQSHA